MIKYFASKKKKIAAVASVLFLGSAFQAGGCNLSIDPNLVQQILGVVENYTGNVNVNVGGTHHRPPGDQTTHDTSTQTQ
jgi:hypothetical protein